MTINVTKCSNVTVIGHHNSRNTKAVYNITNGDIYASVLDTAEVLEVTPASVSYALDDEHKRKCKGMRLCFLSKVMEHFEEISEQNRIRAEREQINAEKAAAFDALMAEKEAKAKAKAKAEERVAAHKAKIEALRRQIEAESASLSEAETNLNQFED